jgi:membrane-associated protease RseP (regulator of RpoE activity)
MYTKIFSTLALVVMTMAAVPPPAAAAGLQPDTPYGLFGEERGSYLGIDTRDVNHERMVALKLKEERGVEITMVDQDAPAGKAGLREQDVILSFNGQPVESVEELRRMIHETPPGRVVTLGISRNGEMLSVKVTLADRRKLFRYPAIAAVPPAPPAPGAPPAPPNNDFNFDMPPMPEFDVPSMDVIVHSSVRGGLMVENLTPQLGDFFGVKNGQGVLVRSVEKGSAAERAGFHAGDVIVRVGTRQVADTSDWRNAMRTHRSGSVPIGVVRDRKPLTISFVVPRQTGQAMVFDPELAAHLDLSGLQDEMDHLRPQIERAQRQAEQEFRKHSEEFRKQAEVAAREAQRQVHAHQREMEAQARKAAEQVQHEMQLHRKDMEKLRRQMEEWKHKADEM